jgi:hypothetical protein
LHILQWQYTQVANVCFKCMLQVFYLDIAYAVLAIYIHCKIYDPNVSPISDLYCKCFIWMLHMFQIYVASVYQNVSLFRTYEYVYLDLLVAIHLFQTHVAKVLSYCNISRRRKRTYADAFLVGVVFPTCTPSEAGVWRVNKHVAWSPTA